METTYYIGGGNGNAILEDILNGLGWKRTTDKNDENVRLKWCETKASINYKAFREKEHMVNHIPNCQILTNKLGLLNSLQEYAKILITIQKKSFKLDFIPETYCLDDPKHRDAFENGFKDGEIWICKPTGRNQGKGIFLVRSSEDLYNQLNIDPDEDVIQKPSNRIIQRYIMNPLLLDGRKFDIRCYMLIACTSPFVVLYHKGYCRLSMYKYDNNCDNIIAHLTNQFIQKRDPRYNETKEDTAWSMEKFNDYINENVAAKKGIPQDWVLNVLPVKMKQIMVHCLNAVKSKLEKKIGYFDLYGLDFLIDESMKVWLIEMNINPCLATNCSALREVVPGVVKETLNLSIECFEKARRGKPLLPLNSLKNFEEVYIEKPQLSKSNPRSPTKLPKEESHKTQKCKSSELVVCEEAEQNSNNINSNQDSQQPVEAVEHVEIEKDADQLYGVDLLDTKIKSPPKKKGVDKADAKKKKVPTATLR